MENFKAAILDDEPLCVDAMTSKLNLHCPEVKVIEKYIDPLEAQKASGNWDIDLLFLDIEMPRLDGFGFLESLDEIRFHIIFTTAYNQHAIRAFRYNAIDYLLKPVNADELIAAVNRFKERTFPLSNTVIRSLIKSVKETSNKPEKLAIPTQNGLEFISLKDIIRLEATQNYTELHLSSKIKILSSRNIKYFENIIGDESNFIRIHHSHIININFATRYQKGEGGTVIMADGTEVDVAVRRKHDFLKIFRA